MIVDIASVPELAKQMMQIRASEQVRLDKISRYMRGRHDPPYAPKGVSAEYRWVMKRGKRNFLPLIVSVISENLHVDGYRPSGTTTIETASSTDTEPSWEAFKANRMVSRQHGVHRSVCKYGLAYIVILPGQMSSDEELEPDDMPVMRPTSPRRMTAFYADDVDDEWPQCAIEVRTVGNPVRPQDQRYVVSLYDDTTRYILTSEAGAAVRGSIANLDLKLAMPGDPMLHGMDPIALHGLGICPVVRFLYESDLDGETDCSGEVEPLIPIQDQINFTTFNGMMNEQYQAFRQRWISGMSPVDEQGAEKAPFRPGVDRVWAAEDPGTKFGEFGENQGQGYLENREASIRHMSTISQVPPYHLLGQIANLSAEALAAARDGLDRKIEEEQSILTDSWRNTFRLAALASGDKKGWSDLNGEVVWRDTSARAFSATIDGLGKAAQMLGIPAEELWHLIPGATEDDVNRWIEARQQYQAKEVVKNAVAAALQSQPGFANVQTTQGGLPVSVPVEIPAGTPPESVTGVNKAKPGATATGGGGLNVH